MDRHLAPRRINHRRFQNGRAKLAKAPEDCAAVACTPFELAVTPRQPCDGAVHLDQLDVIALRIAFDDWLRKAHSESSAGSLNDVIVVERDDGVRSWCKLR